MSLVFALAADLHREIQAAYRAQIENDFRAADDACHGYLLNKMGKALDLDAFSLFTGSETRAYKYAAPELVKHWAERGRLTRAAFEAQYLAALGETMALVERNY
ncbi:hypothetical protein [Glutamicibacter sp. NPDC087673]|uniref:hypothetical protein n=1 Tax=Glutamicibacter sp. NPDC087673 TaxID=3363997 RepID=UPI003809E01B